MRPGYPHFPTEHTLLRNPDAPFPAHNRSKKKSTTQNHKTNTNSSKHGVILAPTPVTTPTPKYTNTQVPPTSLHPQSTLNPPRSTRTQSQTTHPKTNTHNPPPNKNAVPLLSPCLEKTPPLEPPTPKNCSKWKFTPGRRECVSEWKAAGRPLTIIFCTISTKAPVVRKATKFAKSALPDELNRWQCTIGCAENSFRTCPKNEKIGSKTPFLQLPGGKCMFFSFPVAFFSCVCGLRQCPKFPLNRLFKTRLTRSLFAPCGLYGWTELPEKSAGGQQGDGGEDFPLRHIWFLCVMAYQHGESNGS